MKHETTQCANLGAIVTNALANVIETHRFILTECRGKAKPPSPILYQPGGPMIIVHIISSSLNTKGKQSHHRPSSANLEGQRCLMMLQTSTVQTPSNLVGCPHLNKDQASKSSRIDLCSFVELPNENKSFREMPSRVTVVNLLNL